jgi:hypothetical protein
VLIGHPAPATYERGSGSSARAASASPSCPSHRKVHPDASPQTNLLAQGCGWASGDAGRGRLSKGVACHGTDACSTSGTRARRCLAISCPNASPACSLVLLPPPRLLAAPALAPPSASRWPPPAPNSRGLATGPSSSPCSSLRSSPSSENILAGAGASMPPESMYTGSVRAERGISQEHTYLQSAGSLTLLVCSSPCGDVLFPRPPCCSPLLRLLRHCSQGVTELESAAQVNHQSAHGAKHRRVSVNYSGLSAPRVRFDRCSGAMYHTAESRRALVIAPCRKDRSFSSFR